MYRDNISAVFKSLFLYLTQFISIYAKQNTKRILLKTFYSYILYLFSENVLIRIELELLKKYFN